MRKFPMNWLASWLALWLGASFVGAQEANLPDSEGGIRTWRVADGLPEDSVTAIIQTRDGYLWVGTTEGLVRFDGVEFTEIKFGRSEEHHSAAITALTEDSAGHLWVGTQQNGLFELRQGEVRQYTVVHGLLDESVTSLAAGTNGMVWIGTKSGLNLFTGQGVRALTQEHGLPDEFVSNVHVARSGTVWITTRGGMCRFVNGQIVPHEFPTESQGRSPEYLGAYEDRHGNLWAYGDTYLRNLTDGKRFNYFRGNEATSVRIWSLCEGRDGRLWIGTSGRGLYCFDDNRFQQVMLDELRWPYDVRALCEDHEGNLWLGTSGGGLVQLRPQPVHVMRSSQGLPAGTPTALGIDAAGRMHVGLLRKGLYVGEAGRFENFDGGGGLRVQEAISSLSVARDGTVWVGTLGGGLYGMRNGRGIQVTTANGLADNQVLATCLDAEGNIWASTAAGTLHRFSSTNLTRVEAVPGLPRAAVTAMIPARGGGLWLGTEDGSILRGDGRRFVLVQSGEHSGGRPILTLHEGTNDRLWVGTAGAGLICIAGGASATWNTGSHLPSNYIAGIIEDNGGNLWLVTGVGVYRIGRGAVEKSLADPQAPLAGKMIVEARTTTESSTTTGGMRALLAPEGRLWFATTEGLLNVDTRRPEVETGPLSLYIENVAFNGNQPFSVLRSAAWSPAATNAGVLKAPGDVRSLEIEYTALTFTTPEKARFRHKLEGFDTDWVENGTARLARYGRLPYGRYTFRVAARTSEGPWQEAATRFAFEVPTPLYLQPFMIGLYAVASVGMVSGIVRVVSHRRLRRVLAKLEQQQALERERMRIARDMHDEIGSKLTKISFLSEHARVDANSDGPLAGKIESIAETSRDLLQTMDEIVWVVNPHNDTLEHLAAYLSHYADEYFQNTSVECELRLPQAIAHHPVSSETRHNLFLAFEETLNNVLKHSGATNVRVEMAVKAGKFAIIVTDNGCGFDPNAAAVRRPPPGTRGGNGLRNIRQRLADVGGQFEISSQAGRGGTTVTLRIPLPPAVVRKT